MIRSRQSSCALIFAALALIVGVGADRVLAQGARQIMVVNDDDGSGPTIGHFSLPDLMDLREPDFIHRDLPVFQEKLVLSDAQAAAFERQIDVYLQAFEQLKKELLSFPGAEPVFATMVPGRKLNGEEGDGPAGAIVVAPGMGDLPEINLEEMEDLRGSGVAMEVGVRMTAPGSGESEVDEDAEMAEPSVSVSFSSPDGEEIPEKVRQELEKRAAEMVQKIMQQLAEQQEKGELAGNAAPASGPAIPAMGNMEELQQRQAEMSAAAKTFRKAKAELRQEFVLDSQSKLSDPQIERWPALERALLREKSLPKGRLCGERTDVFKVMKNLDSTLPAEPRIAAQLDAYDLEMDAALRQRNDVLEDVGPKVDKAMQEKEFDRALLVLDRAAAARMAVRTLNERYVEAIAAVLSPEIAAELRTVVLKAAYPQVYRSTMADRTFIAAKGIEGLDDATLANIIELEQVYRAERKEIDAQIRRTIDKHQPDEPRRPIESMKTMMTSGGPDGERGGMVVMNNEDPIREALAKRRELDERYMKSVTSLLTPEQIEQLPKAQVRKKAMEPIIIRTGPGE